MLLPLEYWYSWSCCFYSVAFVPQFIEPLTETITVNSSTPNVNVTCRLSDPVPSSVTVQWLHDNDDALSPPRVTSITSVDTVILQIKNFNSSDVGVYRCVFSNNNPMWTLSRSININAVFGECTSMITAIANNGHIM